MRSWAGARSWGAALGVASALGAFACGESANRNGGSGGAAGTPSKSDGGANTTAGSDSVGAGQPGGPGGSGNGGSTGGANAGSKNSGGTAGACMGLACNVKPCATGATTISGTVFAPEGTLQLYNVSVFVPNAPVPEFAPKLACDRCGENEVPSVVRTTSDASGKFVLKDAPVGKNIPLVIQVGRWRRQLVIPSVPACVETKLDAEQTRLPRNKTEGELPRIALVAGNGDQLECFPRRLGIDDSEFTTNAGDGSMHLYGTHDVGSVTGITHFDTSLNAGAQLPFDTDLWASPESLQKYDLLLLGCEGSSRLNEKPIDARQAMYDYTLLGGHLLTVHWQHVWFSSGPPAVVTTGTWSDRQDPAMVGSTSTATVNQTFPKGAALAQWLVNNAASPTVGSLEIYSARDNLQAVAPNAAREWLTLQSPLYPDTPKVVELMSFTTPVGAPAAQACGRAAFAGFHAADISAPQPNDPPQPGFPLNCIQNLALSAQEKALAFMLFDLSSCIAPTDVP